MADQRTSSETGDTFRRENDHPLANVKHGVQITAIKDGHVWVVTQLVQKLPPNGPYRGVKNCKLFVPIGKSNSYELLIDAIQQGLMGNIQKARTAKLGRGNEGPTGSKLGSDDRDEKKQFATSGKSTEPLVQSSMNQIENSKTARLVADPAARNARDREKAESLFRQFFRDVDSGPDATISDGNKGLNP